MKIIKKISIIGAVALPLIFAACGGGGGVEGEAITLQTLARDTTPNSTTTSSIDVVTSETIPTTSTAGTTVEPTTTTEVITSPIPTTTTTQRGEEASRVSYDDFRNEDGTIDFPALIEAGGGEADREDYRNEDGRLNADKLNADNRDFYVYCEENLAEELSDQEFLELCDISKGQIGREREGQIVIRCKAFGSAQNGRLDDCRYQDASLLTIYEDRSGGLTRELYVLERAAEIFASSFNDNSVRQADSLSSKLVRAIGARGECRYNIETIKLGIEYRYTFHCDLRDFAWDEWILQGEWGVNYPISPNFEAGLGRVEDGGGGVFVGDASSCVRYCGAGPFPS